MDKTSTPYSTTLRATETEQTVKVGPSAKSIAFIRQFARCYHAEPRMAPAFAGMILN